MDSRDVDLNELARRLRMARASCNLTQTVAANKSTISQSALSLYEKARREPHATTAKRLAQTYGVSLDWLLGLSDVMRISEPKRE